MTASTGKPPRPPDGIGQAGRRLWRSVTGRYELAPHELESLRQAAVVADRVEALDALVDAEGATITSPQGTKAHPALVEARQHRTLLARLVASLDLPDDDDEVRKVRTSTGQRLSQREARRRGHTRGPYRIHAV